MIATRDHTPAAASEAAPEHRATTANVGIVRRALRRVPGRGPGIPVMDQGAVANRCAVIDVGTNSVKFLIAERDALGGWRTLVDRSEVTRLGQGLAGSGVIGAKGTARTARAIGAMLDEAAANGVEAIATIGTAGLRMAANRDEVVAELASRSGAVVQVIDGDEEGRLA